MKNMIIIILTLLSFSVNTALRGQVANVDSLVKNLQQQLYNYPQEKVHIFTDKSDYFCGDTIWFRGFVVDAATHTPVNASKYLYVELVNPFDSIVNRVKIMERNGIYEGYMPVDIICPEGDYSLIAYTMFMSNLGNDYFFKKDITLKSPFSVQSEIRPKYTWNGDKLNVTVGCIERGKDIYRKYDEVAYTTWDDSRHIRRYGGEITSFSLKGKELSNPYILMSFGNYEKFLRLPQQTNKDFSVSIHPEGGYIIPDSENRIAFKAINEEGRGIDVSGTITDNHGNIICKTRTFHKGMGCFTITPQSGKRYKAEFTDSNGLKKVVELPEANSMASSLKLDFSGDTIIVSSHGNTPEGSFLMIHERGIAMASAGISNSSPQFFLKSWFPSGVIQILLLDRFGNTLSERMFFSRSNDMQYSEITPDSSLYMNRSKVKVKISLKDYSSGKASAAVSVTDNQLASGINRIPIDAQLLLQSDIKGTIEQPSYYFENISEDTDYALDLLMLTQGWRRYNIPEVMKGNYSYPRFPLEIGQEINGEVRRFIIGTPRQGININLMAPKVNYINLTSTDKDGKFSFGGFDFPDSTTFIFQAREKDGDRVRNFEIFNIRYPFSGFEPLLSDIKEKENDNLKNETMMINSDPTMREILLDEVTIIGRKKDLPEDIYELLSSKSYDNDYFKENNITTLREIIQKIAGVNEIDGYLYYRNRVLSYMVDGIIEENLSAPDFNEKDAIKIISSLNNYKVKFSDIELRYPMQMIERVDFIPPYMAVCFGPRAGGGVISIKTKDGSDLTENELLSYLKVYMPLGYQEPAEFYSPKYTVHDNAPGQTDYRSTLYWNPCVKFDNKGVGQIEFYTNDMENTSYKINIEGITDDGKIIKGEKTIEISPYSE